MELVIAAKASSCLSSVYRTRSRPEFPLESAGGHSFFVLPTSKYPRCRNPKDMAQSKHAAGAERSIVADFLEALSDKHSQVDINLQGMNVKFPSTGMSVEFNGLVTVTSHIRDITEDEKKASASKNVAMMTKS